MHRACDSDRYCGMQRWCTTARRPEKIRGWSARGEAANATARRPFRRGRVVEKDGPSHQNWQLPRLPPLLEARALNVRRHGFPDDPLHAAPEPRPPARSRARRNCTAALGTCGVSGYLAFLICTVGRTQGLPHVERVPRAPPEGRNPFCGTAEL